MSDKGFIDQIGGMYLRWKVCSHVFKFMRLSVKTYQGSAGKSTNKYVKILKMQFHAFDHSYIPEIISKIVCLIS